MYGHVMAAIRNFVAGLILSTIAQGALEYYTLANNEARKETPEEAIALDRRLQQAWVGHSQPFTIDNSTSFAGKVDVRGGSFPSSQEFTLTIAAGQRVVNCVDRLVGLPQTRPTFRKFVLRSWPDLDKLPFPHVTFQLNKVWRNSASVVPRSAYLFLPGVFESNTKTRCALSLAA